MRGNRGKHTRAEAALQSALRIARVTGYRRNQKTPIARVDFLFRPERVAVFVHGCFWHRCPVCRLPLPKTHRDFWSGKFRRNRARDKRVRDQLRRLGWVVLEIWGHELGDPKRAAGVVGRAVLARRVKPALAAARPK